MGRGYLNWIGFKILRLLATVQGLGAFALITLGVMVTKSGVARQVIRPLIRDHIYRSGVRLLPMMSFLAIALGLVVIGQMVALLSRVGATRYAGMVMVTVAVRELGPLITALLVLARVGTATVIELGTCRAMGEVEALEVLGIDPVHYLVAPRVIALILSIFSLTVYLILISLGSGYLFAFLQDVPLQPGDYLNQLASSMTWLDFVLLAAKSCAFGSVIAIVTCYHGLAQPMRLEEIGAATTQAVVECVVACVLLDAAFIVVYLVM